MGLSTGRWKTLSRRDPEFLSHLDGSFSATHLALPVSSLNVGTAREEVTFEIRVRSEIISPNSLKVAWQMIRPSSLVFSLGPMVATFFFCLAHGFILTEVTKVIAISSFVGVLFFHIAVNLLNDYGDHMKGQDRLRLRGGTRAIQNGWIRAIRVKHVGWVMIGVAALCGLPAILLHFAPVIIIAALALLVALEFAFQRLRLKYRGWTEVMAFLMTGPLLSCGFAWAMTGEVSISETVLGCIFGSTALMYFHSANFENIMADSQAGVQTWATRTGFDLSKRFFYFTAFLVVTFSGAFVFFIEQDSRLLPLLIAQIFFLVPVSLRVRSLNSPLASGLVKLRLEAVKLCWLSLVALVGGYLWLK
jgi:1,4-dihydroxy-2-naphthoate octaprenyltransferase